MSVDGTWQKRYGHNSLLGMVFVISIVTGCVLGYSVKLIVCHEGSSGAMERDGAIEVFTRSIEKHNLRYTTYVGDGDSNSFAAVKKATQEK